MRRVRRLTAARLRAFRLRASDQQAERISFSQKNGRDAHA
jgi:hypothetical protein